MKLPPALRASGLIESQSAIAEDMNTEYVDFPTLIEWQDAG